ncbi:substrate-binding domain-containing protein [Arthrobacter sp. S39]|uniref:substrate-binding domain-containing protein n=1 Tax=Arthrobacter sp. S39 TaxID=2509720 RepID=UPI001A945BFC|nr:substrate-binding domain-containing protein [Arthrobacter sp. S39]
MNHSAPRLLLAAGAIMALGLTACTSGSSESASAGATAAGDSGCADVVATAQKAVDAASKSDTPWDGPTTGPTAASGKTLVYVAQSMTNPGVAGVAKGLQEAAAAIGWNVKVIDGLGTPAGIQSAFSQALTIKPDGIVIGGFDPKTTAAQVAEANAAKIPLAAWQALSTPGPSTDPLLFTNITTKVEDVAKISADYVIAKSNGNAGVVIFTDSSIPFAEGKSQMIRKELETCSGIKVLEYDNVPLSDVSARMPQEVSSLLSKHNEAWTYSVAINDVYYENAAAALRAGGVKAGGAPFNVGAGDGDSSALQRIKADDYQAATVPSPLKSEGWQIVDELNRAFSGQPASGYVPQIHVSTKENTTATDAWDPAGYQDAYRAIWGK